LSKFFELEARFPDGPEEVPVEAVAYLADAVGVPWMSFAEYPWSGRTIEMQRSVASQYSHPAALRERRRTASTIS
jgi:hypothetical protein